MKATDRASELLRSVATGPVVQIKRLEAEILVIPLFDRIGKRLVLDEAGACAGSCRTHALRPEDELLATLARAVKSQRCSGRCARHAVREFPDRVSGAFAGRGDVEIAAAGRARKGKLLEPPLADQCARSGADQHNRARCCDWVVDQTIAASACVPDRPPPNCALAPLADLSRPIRLVAASHSKRAAVPVPIHLRA